MAAQSKPQQLTPFGAALAGALGACFSTAVVYPLDVAKTRIQAMPSDAKRKSKADLSMFSVLLKVYKSEGLSGWYRGFTATMINTFSQQYAYFFFYSFVRNAYIKRLTSKLAPGAKLGPLSTAAELLLGAFAGALAQIFTIPVSVIATRQQVGRPQQSRLPSPSKSTVPLPSSGSKPTPSKSSADEGDPDSFFNVAKEIVEEEGVGGLWLGLKPGLVLTVNPAITYGLFERVKSVVLLAKAKAGSLGANEKMSPWMSFLVGALSKSLATVVTYPYIMAKVRIQARSADVEDAEEHHRNPPAPHTYHHQDKSKHVGALDILMRVWRREGFSGWYQGMQAQITKAVISQALLFMSKEQFEQWALHIMVLYAQLAARRSAGAIA
ncbi:hypothetical protein AX16_006732 [Volvariella volvacea WC 439]|nr:hypothetical protein AX16_006732 [Volvariella volvacea WC 439]